MAIVKRNDYSPGKKINNLSVNVDDNRLGNDQTYIEVNHTTNPSTITVKVGSLVEVNGNNYAIQNTDETFQMSNVTHEYITFTDNPSTSFGSAATRGTWNSAKQGWYQADGVTRTLRHKIYQRGAGDGGYDTWDQSNKNATENESDSYNSYIIDSENPGALVMKLRVTGTPGSAGTDYSEEFELKKPCWVVMDIITNTNLTAGQVERKYNGAWASAAAYTVLGPSISTVQPGFAFLGPGRYRISATHPQSYDIEIDVRIFCIYGDNELPADYVPATPYNPTNNKAFEVL